MASGRWGLGNFGPKWADTQGKGARGRGRTDGPFGRRFNLGAGTLGTGRPEGLRRPVGVGGPRTGWNRRIHREAAV